MRGIQPIAGKLRNLRGWKRDRSDVRDMMLPAFAAHELATPLPEKFSLRGMHTRIEDQAEIGSCVANATTSAYEHLYRKRGIAEPQFSRLFLYYIARVMVEHVPATEDSGLMIRDAMKAARKYGICYEPTWPYDLNHWTEQPPERAMLEALEHQMLVYYRIPNLNLLKRCIFAGYPVVIGFSVPESIYDADTEQTGIIKYPLPGESYIGGHSVLALGWDNHKTTADGCVEFQNSWSAGWGDNGFGWLPQHYWATPFLVSDCWTIRIIENVPTGG